MRIDSHHHFWRYTPTEYDWIGESMIEIRRDFLPADLKRELDRVGLDGAVSVQAGQTLEETNWLLDLADKNEFLKGVVGWVPLADANVSEILDGLADRRKLKGVRHIVQAEPNERFILRDDFNAGVQMLAEYGLAYDILIYERHLPQTIEFVDRHPNQVFVLDHLAKPRAQENLVEPWRSNIRRLAQRAHVYCKISGIVTEADWNGWTEAQLSVYLETVLDAFTPRRVMFGSDWPVCLVASSYEKWYEVVSRFCDKLSLDEQVRIFGGTATEAYRL
ncbi:MAG TPA: amidohydrolase family protein [Lacipirellulaceae bacterium]|jgi:L-fuconolactonase|nr:amidohydrolase family protein [Lacipirellulaceae bacterium]